MNTTNYFAALAAAVIGNTALAQTLPASATPPAPAPFSVNVGIASSYIYRGLNQSNFKPALQVGADYAHESGFYVGVWASSIRWIKDFGYGNGSAEIDVYAGYKGTAGDIGYDFGLLQYVYPGTVARGATGADTTELYVASTYKMLTLKYSHVVSKATFATPNSRNSGYLDLSATFPLMDSLTLNLHAGRQVIRNSGGLGSYSDGKAELAYDFGNGVAFSGGVTSTNADEMFYTPSGKKFIGRTTPYGLIKYTKSF